MNIENGVKLRLQFLARVVEKECDHLNRTTRRLFAEEYIEDLEILTSAIKSGQNFVLTLTVVTQNLQNELSNRGWQE